MRRPGISLEKKNGFTRVNTETAFRAFDSNFYHVVLRMTVAAADMDRARSVVDQDETILAVWKASPDQAYAAAMQKFQQHIFCPPLLWLEVITCCCRISAWKTNYESTMYILTNKQLYKHYDGDRPVCLFDILQWAPQSGTVSLAYVKLGSANTLPPCSCSLRYIDELFARSKEINTGPLPSCCYVPVLRLIVPPANILSNAGLRQYQLPNEVHIIVNDVAEAEAIFSQAKAAMPDMPDFLPMGAGTTFSMMMGMVMQQQAPPAIGQVVVPATMDRGVNVADELSKLGSMLQQGLLTQAEFQKAKEKLLA